MPKTKLVSFADIDWYLISIDRLKKIGIVLLLIVLGVGGWFYYDSRSKNPRIRAENAISDAQSALNRLASSARFNDFRSEFERGRTRLEEAKSLFAQASYPMAENSARESLATTLAALSRGIGERDADAQFLTIEGEVMFQKPGSEWKTAEIRAPLFNGDWVKTGSNSTAELMFSNGSLYTVGSNALLEIYSLVNPETSQKQNTVKMQIGSIEVNTDEEISTVRTPGTQVVVESKSTAQVGVDQRRKTTEVLNLRGTSSITPEGGGQTVQLTSGEKISATAAGEFSPVKKVLMPPALRAPADNQVFQMRPSFELRLNWENRAGASDYLLQVSRSRLFSTIEINSERKSTEAVVKPTEEGAFYWRVASVDANGEPGPFSTFRRFRMSGFNRSSLQALQSDKTPPTLNVKPPFAIGGQFYMIEGTVEPGASVFINDEEVDVDTSGAFRRLWSFDRVGWNTVVIKAVDPAGNPTVQRENVYVEE